MSEHKFMPLNVELDVYKEIISHQIDVDETPNDILKRILVRYSEQLRSENRDYNQRLFKTHTERRTLHDGLHLSKKYKGKTYTAVVRGGKVVMNGKEYSSPSAAAKEITNNNVNGWMWWKYKDHDGAWKVIKNIFS